MKLYDTKTGAPVEIPDDQVQSAYQSGDYGLPKGSRIPVVMGGVVGDVPSENLGEALDAQATIATPEEIHKDDIEKKYGGLAGGIESSLEGGARGLTLGGSDIVAPAIAGAFGGNPEAVKEHIKGVREQHPYAAMGGEVAGIVAPSLLSGGAAAPVAAGEVGLDAARLGVEGVEAARLAREASAVSKVVRIAAAPVKGVTAAGHLAEEAVAKLVGSNAENLLGRVGQKMLSKGAGSAVEGALFNVASEADEQSLGDAPINGQKLLAATGHGALLGATLGAGVGAGGELGKALVSKISAGNVSGKISESLDHAANEQAFRSTNARKAFTDQANRIPGKSAGVGKRLLDEGIIAAGDTVEEIAPKISAARAEAGKAIGTMLEAADAHGVEGPRLKDIFARVEADVIKDLAVLGESNKGAIGKVTDVLTDLRKFAGVESTEGFEDARLTFKEAHEFRTRLQDRINYNKAANPLAPVNEATEAMKGIRNAIETELVNTGEEGAKKLGGSFEKEYSAAKLRYRQLAVADDAANDSINRAQSNASHSLTDKIAGAAGFAAGVTHGPAGALLGLATGAGSKIVRERGNATAAVLLQKMAALTGVEKATSVIDSEIRAGVKSVFESKAPRIKPSIRIRKFSKNEDLKSEYDAQVRAVKNAVAQADTHVDHISSHVEGLQEHAPNVAAAFQKSAILSTTYLASRIPQSHQDFASLQPHLNKPRVSDTDMHNFLTESKAIQDPVYTIFNGIQTGNLKRTQVDAIKATSPDLLKEIQGKVREQIYASGERLPYAKAAQISILLDVPADKTFEAPFIKAMQGNFVAPAPDSSQNSAPAAPKRQLGNVGGAGMLPGQLPKTG